MRVPPLRPWRVASAVAIAVVVDAVQIVAGPLGWSFADEVLDVVAMVAEMWLLGFHVLLLPTFMLELVPVVDVLPTWTGCVGIVIARRRASMSGVPSADDAGQGSSPR
jgi:hypothetical protein